MQKGENQECLWRVEKNQEGSERSDAVRSALDTSFFETRRQEKTVSKDVHFLFIFIWPHRDVVAA